MAKYTFNPFIGNFDAVGTSNSAATSVGKFQDFVIADFTPNAGFFDLIVPHNLVTLNPITNVFEGTDSVIPHKITIDSLNQLTLTVDTAFDGVISIIKP